MGVLIMNEIIERLGRIEETVTSVLEEVSALKEELEEKVNGEERDLPVKVELLRKIAEKGGVITRKELHEMWKSFGRDTRGLGGFFKSKNPLIAEGAEDKIFITKYGEKLLKEYLDEE
jgi:regulator of replication initiation timing